MESHNYLPSRAPLLLSAVGLFSFVMATMAVPTLPSINTNNIISGYVSGSRRG